MVNEIKNKERGFTLVELIAVMILIAVVAASVSTRMLPNSTVQVQAARDLLVTSLFVAQQKAMTLTNSVQLITTATTIDIRVDANGDSTFSSSESITTSGSTYPMDIPGGVSLSVVTFDYDRLGFTGAGSITVQKDGSAAMVSVSGTGYAY